MAIEGRLAAFGALCVMYALAATAPAATFTVTATTDSGPGSLRQAMLDANTQAGSDIINITATGVVALQTTLPVITEDLEINGPGPESFTLTRAAFVPSGQPQGVLFVAASGTTIKLAGMRIWHPVNLHWEAVEIYEAAIATIQNCVFERTGGIANFGQITVEDCVARANSFFRSAFLMTWGFSTILTPSTTCRRTRFEFNAVNPSGVFVGTSAISGGSGAINTGTGPALIEDCVFVGNAGYSGAGAISLGSQSVTIRNCIFRRNVAHALSTNLSSPGAGAIASAPASMGSLSCDDCLFEANSCAKAGAVSITGGSAVFRNCSFLENFAVDAGGHGGAIACTTCTLSLYNCTFHGNRANPSNGKGGAMYAVVTAGIGTAPAFYYCTVTGNDAPGGGGGIFIANTNGTSPGALPLALRSTVVALNAAGTTGLPDLGNGPYQSNGYNLVGNVGGTTISPGTEDQFGTATNPLDPLLGPVAFHGGTVPTRLPRWGSPLIDRGGVVSGTPNDARGAPRVFDFAALANAAGGNGSDVGAAELQRQGTIGVDSLGLNFRSGAVSFASAAQVIIVEGFGTGSALTVTAPTDFQVSLAAGTGYSANVTTGPPGASGNVAPTSIYVRYLPGTGAAHAGMLTISNATTETCNVPVAGTLLPLPAPEIIPAVTEVGLPATLMTSGVTSNVKSYSLTGSHLSGPVSINVTGPFEVSFSAQGPFGVSLISPAPIDGLLTPLRVWYRYTPQSGLRHGGTLVHTSPVAAPVTVHLWGELTRSLDVDTTRLDFTAPIGSPSQTQHYTIWGVQLLSDVSLGATGPFQLSLSPAGPFSTSLVITRSVLNDVAPTWVHVRYLPVAGDQHGGTITQSAQTATGLVTVLVGLLGTVNPTPPTGPIITSTSGLAFSTPASSTIPAVQSYTVSGTGLTGPISIALSSPFRVSLSPTGGFAQSISTGSPVSGAVPATTIYVEYDPAGGGGSGTTITHSSPGVLNTLMSAFGEIDPPGPIVPSMLDMQFSTPIDTISVTQTYTVGGTQLSAPILLTTTPPFEISVNGSPFALTGATLAPVNGVIAPNIVTVRYVPTNGPVHGATIVHESAGASAATTVLRGAVLIDPLAPPPALLLSAAGFSLVAPAAGTPSAAQAFTVSGGGLSDAITVSVPSPFEVSLTAGTGFSSSVTTAAPVAGHVALTDVFVRYNPAAGPTHTDTGVVSSNGAATLLLGLTGIVQPQVNVTALAMTFMTPGGPSAEQSYFVSGSNLSAALQLSVSPPFEITLTSGAGFTQSVAIQPAAGGAIPSTTVYVRYNPASGTSHTGAISHDTLGLSPVFVTLDGAVQPPGAIMTSAASLAFVTTAAGVASPEQSYSVQGSNLLAPIVVSVGADFEVSLTPGSGFGQWVMTAPPVGGNVAPTTVYVRYLPAAGTAHAGTIVHSSQGAPTVTLSLTGVVIPPPPILQVSVVSLLFESAGVGTPSPKGSYSISGTLLTGNVTITAPQNFEVSLTGGSGFSASVVLATSPGTLAPTDIYVRYVPASPGPHSATLTHTSPGAASVGIALHGTIVAPPTSSSPGGAGDAGCARLNSQPVGGTTTLLLAAPTIASALSSRRRRIAR